MITEVDGTGTTETHYIWCGEVICQKRDANGQLLRAYYPEGEYGPEIGKRVAKADAGIEADEDGDERYGRDQDAGKSDQPAETTGSLIYARNHLGSVTDTLTLNGRAVTHTEYGPYGELVKSQGRAEYRADFGYAGMQYHAASGMYLTLFRAYDPGTGRWVSRDPIGERGGINLYAYVGGQPTRYADPNGLCIEDLCIGEAIVVGRVAYQGYRAYRTYQAATRIADAIKAAKSNDDDVGGQCTMKNSQKGDGDGGMPGNNQDQNKQAKDAARAAKLDSSQQRELHDAISGQGYNYQQILEIAREIASGMY
ncbi:hypothetical protein LMG9673_04456 [Ralstonia pseudosolanacearum]|nr:hypothetical protein LMG9673_04456 [Ralstonia pseudosolanacearum]